MARSMESQMKRARELARKERRERKQEKKAAREAARVSQPDESSPSQSSADDSGAAADVSELVAASDAPTPLGSEDRAKTA